MNLVKNASFLDGTQGFVAPDGGVLSVDDQIFGAPGRSVLVLTDTPGNGNPMTLSMDYPEGPAVTSGDLLEVFLMTKSTIPNPTVKLQIQAGSEVSIPLKEQNPGAATRGVPSTFNIYRGRVISPSTGQARLSISAVASNGSQHAIILFHPYIEKVAVTARQRMWTPGEHYGADLDLPVWPSNLPPFRSDSIQCQPMTVRRSFSGDVPRPATTRIANNPSYRFSGDLELNGVQLDALENLCYAQPEPFWFVRPDTAELCHAYWAEDGSPSTSGGPNPIRKVSIGLILEVV
jgi:hypothetical protein